MNKQIGHFTIQ